METKVIAMAEVTSDMPFKTVRTIIRAMLTVADSCLADTIKASRINNDFYCYSYKVKKCYSLLNDIEDVLSTEEGIKIEVLKDTETK